CFRQPRDLGASRDGEHGAAADAGLVLYAALDLVLPAGATRQAAGSGRPCAAGADPRSPATPAAPAGISQGLEHGALAPAPTPFPATGRVFARTAGSCLPARRWRREPRKRRSTPPVPAPPG